MTLLTKLFEGIERFIDRSPFRWVAISLLAVALIGAAVYSYTKIDRELTDAALDRRESVAQITAITLGEKFGRSTDLAVSLATRVQFRKLVGAHKWDKAIDILHSAPSDFPYIDRIILADPGGTLRADIPILPGALGLNFASRDWYKGVSRDWRPYISNVFERTAVPKLNVFAVAVPVRSMTGQISGILVLQIRIERLMQWLEGIKHGDNETIYLVDPAGQLLFRSMHGDGNEIASMPATPLVQKLEHTENHVDIGLDEVNGKVSIVAYSAVPGHDWGVVATQPVRTSMILAAKDIQLRQLLAGYGIILLLGILSATLMYHFVNVRQRAAGDRLMKAELEQRVAERTTELRAVNQELEAFSYSVSHDLRAPLRAVDGFSQALLEDYTDLLDEKARGYIDRIRAATHRMALLIDDMLTLSRVTRVRMKRETVDLSLMAAEVVAELRKSDPLRKVDLRIAPGLVAQGDTNLLRVMMDNLFGNAWKYTSRQPQPRIEFGATVNDDGTIEYYVRDNGVGFDMLYADKLFGAFQRLHTASEFPGTGIGLATVQRVIHRHGGKVRGMGVAGLGATFSFTLPG